MPKPLTKGQARTRAKAIIVNWLEGYCEIPDPDLSFSDADETLIGAAIQETIANLRRGAHGGFLDKLREMD